MKTIAIIATAVGFTALLAAPASAQYIPPPVGGSTIVIQPSPTAPIPSPVPMPGPRY